MKIRKVTDDLYLLTYRYSTKEGISKEAVFEYHKTDGSINISCVDTEDIESVIKTLDSELQKVKNYL